MKDTLNVFSLRMVKEKSVKYNNAELKIMGSESVYRLIEDAFELSTLPEEILVLVCLDTKNQVTGLFKVSHGTLNSSIVHPRELFKRALLANANSIIMAHNHPSGDPSPSPEDIGLTRRIEKAGELMGLSCWTTLL